MSSRLGVEVRSPYSSPGALNVLPDDDNLIGIVAHAIVERLFEQRKGRGGRTRPQLKRRAWFDDLAVELFCGSLLRVGNAVEYQRAKAGVVDAQSDNFVIIISNAGLTMCEAAKRRSKSRSSPGQKSQGLP